MKYVDYDVDLHKTYARGRSLAPDVVAMWMEIVLRWVEPFEVRLVIDLGAGTGRFSAPLADALEARVVALDPARRMLTEIGQGVYRVQGRAESLPFPASTFDLIFASMVLHHVEDLDVAGREIARVLSPRGSVLIRTSFPETLETPYHQFFPSVRELEIKMLLGLPVIAEVLGRYGLSLMNRARVRQRTDRSWREYAERIRLRAMSPFRMISDEEFECGMARLDEIAQAEGKPEPVIEEIDLVQFRKV